MKTCRTCKESKPLSEFNTRNDVPDKKQYHCRVCEKINSRQRYQENKQYHLERINKRRLEHRNRIREEYFSKGCIDCGITDFRVLEFDHLQDKKKGVAKMLSHSWDSIVAEIEKCELRCANCHRIKTYERSGWV